VNTGEQQIRNQRLELERAGYDVAYWFADEGVSAKVPALQRLQFCVLLDKIRDGETLVVSKLDRLGRNAQDIGATINMLAVRRIEVIVLQLGNLDLTSLAGQSMLTMLAAMAEMEQEMLVEGAQPSSARIEVKGKTLGRPSSTTAIQRAEMAARFKAGESISALSRDYKVSRASVMRVVKPAVVQ
jgi:DNA invertase Pin-like site-specific DNA recombinase